MTLLCLGNSAEGGIVSFTPDTVLVEPSITSLASLEVYVSAGAIGEFDALDLLFLSDDLLLFAFSYSDEFVSKTSLRAPPTTTGLGIDFANHYMYVGGLLEAPVERIFVGTLTVDATGLAPDDYRVMVGADGGLSALGLGVQDETLSGVATVHVVPEPTTVLTWGLLGVLALGWRRR